MDVAAVMQAGGRWPQGKAAAGEGARGAATKGKENTEEPSLLAKAKQQARGKEQKGQATCSRGSHLSAGRAQDLKPAPASSRSITPPSAP
eukprot:365353-Chlamydomonas_euryale.AAC.6